MKYLTIKFIINNSKSVYLICEVADSVYKKTSGLMYRQSLSQEHGMLFPFQFSWFRIFWMKNVKIPLDIIFVDKNFKISKICEKSEDTNIIHKNYWAAGYAKYIIECNKGFCKNNNILIGTKVAIS